MSRRDRVRVLAAAVVLLLFGGVARAQTATPPDKASGVPQAGTPLTAPGETAADTPEPEWRWKFLSAGFDLSDTSAYVWRGWVLHDGACFQPDLWVAVGDVTVTSWMNMRHSGGGDVNLDEHDLTVDYSRAVKRVTLSAGWTNYRYRGLNSGHSNEFYVGARADVPLQPGVQIYQDVEQGTGTYVSLSAGHEVPLGKRLSAAGQVALGYNSHQYIEGSGFSDVAVTAKLSIPIPSARAALEPMLIYSHSLMPDQFPSKLFGGLAVAFK